MNIDLATFAAQIINFLILVFLLKRFLYGPIVAAMDGRKARIEEREAEAVRAREEAQKEADRLRAERQDLEARRQELLSKAGQEADGRRKELLHQARSEVEDQQARWRESLRQEKESFLKDLRERTTHQIWSLARQALADLANADLEQQVAKVFVEKVAELAEDERRCLVASMRASGEGALIRSAFELPPYVQDVVSNAVAEHLDRDLEVRYEVAPEVVAGIELKGPDQKIAWSVDAFLDVLEQEVAQEIDQAAVDAGGEAERA